MRVNICFCGSGGQGIITAASILCEACIKAGKSVTLVPRYEAAVRGGKSYVDIVVSDSEIECACFDRADIVVCLSRKTLASARQYFGEGTVLIVDEAIGAAEGDTPAATVSLPFAEITRDSNCQYPSLVVAAFVAGYAALAGREDFIACLKEHSAEAARCELACIDLGFSIRR